MTEAHQKDQEFVFDPDQEIRGQVKIFLQRNKDADNSALYGAFPGVNQSSLRKHKSVVLKEIQQFENDVKKAQQTPRLPKKCSFKQFTRVLSYPYFYGSWVWQDECFQVVDKNRISEVVVPRDHGKSILFGNVSEYYLQYKDFDVLYLGWTDRRKQVAENVYTFFSIWDLLDSTKSSISSPYHFKLKNGGRFDTYSVTSKETLGMHGLGRQDRFAKLKKSDLAGFDEVFTEAIKRKYMSELSEERLLLIVIDDPIDETFRQERWKEEKLEMKYDSTIANINPDKLIISGTRKFLGDFFDFTERKYGEKLARYVRRTHLCTPVLKDLHIFKNINFELIVPGMPRYNEIIELMASKAEDHPCYNPTLSVPDLRYKPGAPPSENLLCPEHWTEEKLQEKREEIGEYWWHAEFEGNPHPITGAVWDKLHFVTGWGEWRQWTLAVISLDRATTTGPDSSFTGITIQIRNDDNWTIVIKDLTGKYDLDECLDIVQEQFDWLDDTFFKAEVVVVVEKQGGGDDFITSAENRGYDFAPYIEPVHQAKMNKIDRIKDYLKIPINKGHRIGGMSFLDVLSNGELISEIKEFPYPAMLDGIDSLATGRKVAESIPLGGRNYEMRAIAAKLKDEIEKVHLAQLVMKSPVFDNPAQNPNYYKTRRKF